MGLRPKGSLGVHGEIRPGERPAVCAHDESRPTFTCFAMSDATKAWEWVGGWTT